MVTVAGVQQVDMAIGRLTQAWVTAVSHESTVQMLPSSHCAAVVQLAHAPPVAWHTWPVQLIVKQAPTLMPLQSDGTAHEANPARSAVGEDPSHPVSSDSASTMHAREKDMQPPTEAIVSQPA
jgi:hypothetical protein